MKDFLWRHGVIKRFGVSYLHHHLTVCRMLTRSTVQGEFDQKMADAVKAATDKALVQGYAAGYAACVADIRGQIAARNGGKLDG